MDRIAALAHADVLNERFMDLIFAGDYPESERLAREIIAIREAHHDLPADLASARGNLAAALVEQGRYDEAEALLHRALDGLRGQDDRPEVAALLNTLATLHEVRGELTAARPLFERALAILEAHVEPGDPLIAAALNNLARLLVSQGDLQAARGLLARGVEIMAAAAGQNSLHLATVLHNLAQVLVLQREYLAALPLMEHVLHVREEGFGPTHPHVAITLNNFAGLLQYLGRSASAVRMYERAQAIFDELLGPGHPLSIGVLGNLAWTVHEAGDHGRARVLYGRALAYLDHIPDAPRPLVARTRLNVAFQSWALGQAHEAREHALRAIEALDEHVAEVFPWLSPAEQRAFLDDLLGGVAGLVLSLFASDPPGFARAYGSLAGWKGLLLVGLRHQSAVGALEADPAHAPQVAALRNARMRVAHLLRGDPRPDELAAAERERERLERGLAGALPAEVRGDPWAAAEPAGLAALRAALAPGAAFVDVFDHAHSEDASAPAEWRYSAVVTTRHAAPVQVPIAPDALLDPLVDAWREERYQDGEGTAALAAAVWGPVAAALPGHVTRVWVAPDGALTRLPWDALARLHARRAGHAEDGVLVALVPSARALLTLLTTAVPAASETVLVVGAVDFGAVMEDTVTEWNDLPGTADEVRTVSALARAGGLKPRRLTGRRATPAAVATAAQQAGYVHVATHGFFGGESHEAYAVRLSRAGRHLVPPPDDATTPSPGGAGDRSPLASSGLALAGANRGPRGNLTAEEIVGLSLAGVRLVVLSACDTGRGAEVTGQGVLGLQAAVHAAGARALMMSLWPVDDDATAWLMETFYRCLWSERRSPAEALREAQQQVRGQPGWEAPAYWAGWSLVGDVF